MAINQVANSLFLFLVAGLCEIGGGWIIDGTTPDRFDAIGAGIALAGVSVIMYWPR